MMSKIKALWFVARNFRTLLVILEHQKEMQRQAEELHSAFASQFDTFASEDAPLGMASMLRSILDDRPNET